jgi:dUTP pyrophosphatase
VDDTLVSSVTFDSLFDNVTAPARATEASAGYDVYAHLVDRTVEMVTGTQSARVATEQGRLVIPPGARAAIPLGFRATLPAGIEAQLRLRSSAAFRRGLIMPNAPATIDPDYPGEWMVIVSNAISEPVTVEHGERIAQIVFSRFETVRWDAGLVGVTSSRTGGIGSTGV